MSKAHKEMLGRRVSLDSRRRCDFCGKAVNHGYLINDERFKGFFCGSIHARAAYKHMKDEQEKEKN